MVQASTTALSFKDFIATYPERGDRYELIEGEVIPVRPRGQHELIAGFLALQFGLQIQQQQQDWLTLLRLKAGGFFVHRGFINQQDFSNWPRGNLS